MSVEAVKRQILIAVDALSIPLNRIPSPAKIAEACSAAKLLRNRLLREHTRVVALIESLRERQMFNEGSDDEANYGADDDNAPLAGSSVSRMEFIFVSEMMIAEKLVIPLLLAHGMNHSDSLLPQLLKLLAVMLLPVPRYSAEEVLQRDLLQRIKARCGTDEFFALLVQCVAPIAEKRTSGELQRDDVVILEIVLTLITYLLDGSPSDTERIIGAFCRNHGIELLLVVINQNFSRVQNTSKTGEAAAEAGVRSAEEAEDVEVVLATTQDIRSATAPPADAVAGGDSGADEIDLEDEDTVSLSDSSEKLLVAADQEFQQQVHNLLESDEQLWKWNCLALASIASVIQCVPPEELAQLTMADHSSATSPDQLLHLLRNGQQLRDCKKSSEKWRFVAKSRNGSVTSNGILVRGGPTGSSSGRAIGTVSSLLGTRRRDPLEVMKEMDLQKRGRFIKGMFQGAIPPCNLPLPTKILFSQQNNSFLCFGFEPLSAMVFSELQTIAATVERATHEHREVVAGYKGSGETLEISSPIDTVLYQRLRNVLDYMSVCRCTLRHVRILAEQLKLEQMSFFTMFPQQWQSVSSIIALNYLELGFSVLRSFLDCKDIRRREDITNVVGYISEILLVLTLLLQGDIAADPAIEVAAHALASSVLYKEENIKAVFGLLSEYSSRVIAIRKAQVFTLFTFSVFQLMEKCSYGGNLLFPKRPKKQKAAINVPSGEAADVGGVQFQDDNESVDSATLEEMHDDMLRDMDDMIDDEGSEDGGEKTNDRLHESQPTETPVDVTTPPPPKADEKAGAAPSPAYELPEESEDDEATGQERAFSEGRPPSITSSGRTTLSTLSSEREVAVSDFFHRLATPRNIGLIYSTLRHWRVNDADVNLALTFLMKSLVESNCETVFFNVAFLLLMREVIVYGETTHGPLYAVCDRIVYDFFNPPYAKAQDARAATLLPDEVSSGMLSGAQSSLGFEVSLRCTRALFNYSAVDYAYLEEKGMPHLMDYTVLPLPHEEDGAEERRGEPDVAATDAAVAAASPDARSPPSAAKSHRKHRKAPRTEAAAEDREESERELDLSSADDDGDQLLADGGDDSTREKRKKKKAKSKEERRQRRRERKKRRREEGLSAAAEERTATAEEEDQFPASAEAAEELAAAAEIVAAAVPFFGSMEETLVVEETQSLL